MRRVSIFPARALSPVAGWIMVYWVTLMEGSYIGGAVYELFVQFRSVNGHMVNAFWMALITMPFAGVFVGLFGFLPIGVFYVVMRTSSVKHNLRFAKRVWLGLAFGTLTSLFFLLLTRSTTNWTDTVPLLLGIEFSAVVVMVTLNIEWLGVDAG